MKNFFKWLAVLAVALVFVGGCVQQTPTTTPNSSSGTPETPAAPPAPPAPPAAPPVAPPVNNTPAPPAPPAPPAVITHSIEDCTMITVEDIKSVCGDNDVTLRTKAKPKASTVCIVEFSTADNLLTEPGRSVTLAVDVSTTAGIVNGALNSCRTGFGVPVGTYGCRVGRGAMIGVEDKYIIGLEAATTLTPEKWVCTENQTTDLIKLIESRLP